MVVEELSTGGTRTQEGVRMRIHRRLILRRLDGRVECDRTDRGEGITTLAAVGTSRSSYGSIRTGDGSGVSLSAATLGARTEVGVVFHTVQCRWW
jgi:hypothetical protein